MLNAIPRLAAAAILAASVALAQPPAQLLATSWLASQGTPGSVAASPLGGGAQCYFYGRGGVMRIYPPNVWSSNGATQTVTTWLQLQKVINGRWTNVGQSYPYTYRTMDSGYPLSMSVYRDITVGSGTYRLVAAIEWPTGSGLTALVHEGYLWYTNFGWQQFGSPASSCTFR